MSTHSEAATPDRSTDTETTRTTIPAADASRSTIGATLERHRLEHRVRRIELVLHALKRKADAHAAHGEVPAALHRAISAFSQELTDVNDRLTER
jgi:hypothetical protein